MQVARPRWFARFIERSLAVAGVLFLIYHSGFSTAEVISGSMGPTLNGTKAGDPTNDWVLYESLSPKVVTPPRGKIVVFRNEDGVLIVKRIAGLPGERLNIAEGGRLVVDGVVQAPPAEGVRYLRAGNLRPTPDRPATFEVPAGAVFLLGDDSKDSWDSRYFGALETERLQGRAVAVIWPPSRWRLMW
jgi:signal peptidase I